MGKASSAKKVARAARAGGSSTRKNRPKLAFPLAIFVVLVVGALLVVYSRGQHSDSAAAETAPSYKTGDHWHAAYGLYVCGKGFLPNLTDVQDDTLGIHTHGEGIIHIHPFVGSSSGTNARMKVFAQQVGLKLSDDGWTMPDGTSYKNGYDCDGKPGKFAIYRWTVDDPSAPIEVFDQNVNNIHFEKDRQAYTFAIIPDGAEPPPKPQSIPTLDQLTDVNGGGAQSTPTGAASDPSQTLQVTPTTAAGATPTTAAGATPTTAAGATPTTAKP
jgi:hypothetical protein